MQAYLTADEADARLWEEFAIESAVTDGDLLAASNELDRDGGPWIGHRLDSAQERAFPRDRDPQGAAIAAGAAPPAEILTAVALLAHLASTDEGAAIKSYSVLDKSITYETAQRSPHVRRVASLVAPYQRRVGSMHGDRYYGPEYLASL